MNAGSTLPTNSFAQREMAAGKLKVLYAFPSEADGAYPTTPYFSSDGKVYGTNYVPGGKAANFYVLNPGSGGYTEQILVRFTKGGSLGVLPTIVRRDAGGNFWGVSSTGVFRIHQVAGSWNGTLEYPVDNANRLGEGVTVIGNTVYFSTHAGSTIVRLTRAGSGYTAKTIYAFSANSDPSGLLTKDAAGDLYGTTYAGGTGFGSVFELTPVAKGYTEHDLYDFTGGTNGAGANNGVTIDASGAFYGATVSAGPLDRGTIYKLTPQGSGYSYALIDDVPNGFGPRGPVTQGASGSVYFTTPFTTAKGHGGGGVFELTPSGNAYTESTLYAFGTPPALAMPEPELRLDSSGNVYGSVDNGGDIKGTCEVIKGCGAVFELLTGS